MGRSGIRFEGDDTALADVFQGHHRSRFHVPTKTEVQEEETSTTVPVIRQVESKRRLMSISNLPDANGINIISDLNAFSEKSSYLTDTTVDDRFKLQNGDILLSRAVYAGRIRTFYIATPVEIDIIVNDWFIVIRRRPGAPLKSRSLYGLLCSPIGIEMLDGTVSASGVISVKKLRNLRFSFPPPSTKYFPPPSPRGHGLNALDRLVHFKEIESKFGHSGPTIVDAIVDVSSSKSRTGSLADEEANLDSIKAATDSHSKRYPFESWSGGWMKSIITNLLEPWVRVTYIRPNDWNRRLITWILRAILLARIESDSKFKAIRQSAESAWNSSTILINRLDNLAPANPASPPSEDSESILRDSAIETAENMLDSIIQSTYPHSIRLEGDLGSEINILERDNILDYLTRPTGILGPEERGWLDGGADERAPDYQRLALTYLVSEVCTLLSTPEHLVNGGAEGFVCQLHVVFEEILKGGCDTIHDGLQTGLMRLPEGPKAAPVDVAIVSSSMPTGSYLVKKPEPSRWDGVRVAANPRMLSGSERAVHFLGDLDDGDSKFLNRLLSSTGNEISERVRTKFSVNYHPPKGKKRSIPVEVLGLLEFDRTETDWLHMGSNREKAREYLELLFPDDKVLLTRVQSDGSTAHATAAGNAINHPQYDRVVSQVDSVDDDLTERIRDAMSMIGEEGIAVIRLPADVLWRSEFSVVRNELLKGSDELRARGWSEGEDTVECVIRFPDDNALLVINRKKKNRGRILFVNSLNTGLWSPDPSDSKHTANQIETLIEVLRVGAVKGFGRFEMGAAFVSLREVLSEDSSIIEPYRWLDSSGMFRTIIDAQELIDTLKQFKNEVMDVMNKPNEISDQDISQLEETISSGRSIGGPNDPTRE